MVTPDLLRTLAAMEKHQWQVVLLAPLSKRPAGRTWEIMTRAKEVKYQVEIVDMNIGLVCGPDSGVAVLDFDLEGALAEMCGVLGPVEPWVMTGSGKTHCYVRWEDGLPARMTWQGQKVGEIQRGPALQHVVMPPSVHPDTRKPYTWLVDPEKDLPVLPDLWRQHLVSEIVPSFIPLGDTTGHPLAEPWVGPPPEELLRRAMMQPGAKRRRNGVKMQCPGCRREGHDRSHDNAIVGLDGRWGCALDPGHKKDIAEALGVQSVRQAVLGELEDELRDVSIDDLG